MVDLLHAVIGKIKDGYCGLFTYFTDAGRMLSRTFSLKSIGWFQYTDI